jgi:sugar phosphate isomerase/epimerase
MQSEAITDGWGLIERLQQLDIDGVELDYRIHPAMVPGIKIALREYGLSVSSIHNYFPVPETFTKRQGSGDFFNLAGLDPDERREAIKWSIRSIEMASEFGARVVVIHGGKVEIDAQIAEIRHAFEENTIESKAAQRLIAAKLAKCQSKKPPHLDALRFSLDKLIGVARKQGVLLALENRNHYHELPAIDDFDGLFAEFSGAPMGYWHDTGHEHVMQLLKYEPPGTLLQKFSGHLIGIHIHDSMGIADHLPPGAGEIDFTQVISYLKDPVMGVIELKSKTSLEKAAEGIAWFRKKMN